MNKNILLPLKIDGQFTQTNKNQPRVIHYKNNFFFFEKTFIMLFYNFSMYFIIYIFTPF